jgi:hypothetical protein
LSVAKRESTDGVKIFFVVPELSTFPEEFLKSFFLMGYEPYFLDDDPYCPLEAKIHAPFTLFTQLILFFNIDRPIRGIILHVDGVLSLQRVVGADLLHNLRAKMDSLLSHECAAIRRDLLKNRRMRSCRRRRQLAGVYSRPEAESQLPRMYIQVDRHDGRFLGRDE